MPLNKNGILEIDEIADIGVFIRQLHKACHKKGCVYPESCPHNCCCGNKRSLGVHTALMWEVAKRLEYIIEWYGINKYYFEHGIRKLEKIFNVIFLSTIIKYHKNKFAPNFYYNFRNVIQYLNSKAEEVK